MAALMLLVCMAWLTACSDNDDGSPKGGVANEMAGHWYYTDDNVIWSLTFKADGTGTATINTYAYGGWAAETTTLQYTIADNLVTIKPARGEVFVGVAGIVGNSLSLTDGDVVFMLTRYDGSESKINELKAEYEDNLIDPLPSVSPGNENMSQVELDNIVNLLYRDLGGYEYKQLLLEKIRLTGKDFQGNRANPITPNSNIVYDTWTAAFTVINKANFLVAAIENSDNTGLDEQTLRAYADEARAIRCIVYLNIAQLWGNVPYITTYDKDNTFDATQMQILSPQDLYAELDNTLRNIDMLADREHGVTKETVKAMLGEIALCRGNREEAAQLLSGCQPDFSIVVSEQDSPEIYQALGDRIPNYTPEKTNLLLQEAMLGSNADAHTLAEAWRANGLSWGYWSMLKRIGLAQETAGCEEHELLMPLPQIELEVNAALKQNPGY